MSILRKLLLGFLVLGNFSVIESFACHDVPFFTIGHKPKYSFNYTTVMYTEEITASTATTTQCDWYTYFIEREYPLIAEEAARGQGPHLEALAQMMGCSTEVQPTFAATLQRDYENLFPPNDALRPVSESIETEQTAHSRDFIRRLKVLIAQDQALKNRCSLT